MNFFDHKDLGNHLVQLCPKVVKHPYIIYRHILFIAFFFKDLARFRVLVRYYFCSLTVQNRATQIPVSRSSGRQNFFFPVASDISVFSVCNLLSCHPCGAQNFEMAPRFLEYLCTPAMQVLYYSVVMYLMSLYGNSSLTTCLVRLKVQVKALGERNCWRALMLCNLQTVAASIG